MYSSSLCKTGSRICRGKTSNLYSYRFPEWLPYNGGFLKDGRYEEVEEEIKAAGGISSFDDAEKFISLGASRLIKIMKNTDDGAGY